MNPFTFWILRVIGFLCCLPLHFAMVLADWATRKRVAAPEASAAASPEESERSAMLPHKLDPVTPDRPAELWFASPAESIGFALAAARARVRMEKMELEAARQRAIDQEIAEMLGPVKEGDPR